MREETRDGSDDGASSSSADTRRRGRRSLAHRGSLSEGATEDRGTDRVSSIVSVSYRRVSASVARSSTEGQRRENEEDGSAGSDRAVVERPERERRDRPG